MLRKTPERLVFDKAIDELRPFLPPDYGARVRALHPEVDLSRLWKAVRKRGTTPDWRAYTWLIEVKLSERVERKPRKRHKPRVARQLQTS